jgi:hypothetical protein
MKSRTIVVGVALAVVSVALALALPLSVFAQLNITAQNGQVWRIQTASGSLLGVPTADTSTDPSAFDGPNGYGILSLRLGNTGALFTPDNFNVALDGTGRRATSTTAWTTANVPNLQVGDGITGLSVTRQLYAPSGSNYIRVIDCFSNMSGTSLTNLQVGWGAMAQQSGVNMYDAAYGTLGSDETTTLANTSSGDTNLTTADTWSITTDSGYQSAPTTGSFTPNPNATNWDPAVGVIFHNAGGLISGFGSGFTPFSPWAGNGNDDLTYLYNFNIAAGETAYIAHFVYTGTPNTTKAIVEGELNTWNYNTAFSDLTAPDLARVLNFSGAAAIPEPGTLALFIGVAGTLPFLRRKR